MKKFISVIISLIILLSLSITSIAAERQWTIDEAKDYLQNYNITKTNSIGKEYTTEYIFHSEDDLEKAALYIVENGLSAFNAALESAIADAVSKEPQAIIPYSVSPSSIYRTVSGNGPHYVSAIANGLANFDTLGTVEYQVELGYKVTVTNGKFTNLTSISFDIPYVSAAGSWGHTRFPSYCKDYNCGVTANFDITKTVEVGVGDFSFEVKSETDNEVFALLTNLA